jgi:hypothetical protein
VCCNIWSNCFYQIEQPLHLVILALASPQVGKLERENESQPARIIKTVLNYFPGAVAVADNDGNLPIHIAVTAFRGSDVVNIIYLLLDEARRQVEDPNGVRFRNKSRTESFSLNGDAPSTRSDFIIEEDLHCTLVVNDNDETPLVAAIRAHASWKVVEALVSGRDGSASVQRMDFSGNTPLHLLVSDEYKDPTSVMTMLKTAPEAARIANQYGMLPIEIACMHKLPFEVIFALALVDLPFDVEDTACIRTKEDCGASWYYLTCECDDQFTDIVENILSMCSYPQIRQLCFFTSPSGEQLLSRATPNCLMLLQRALRFLGRFEFVGDASAENSSVDTDSGYRLFSAIDYGINNHEISDGKLVLLKCYTLLELYEREVRREQITSWKPTALKSF